MDNMNIDADKMNSIKNMVDNGNISGAISQISPDMIQNISKMLSGQNNSSNTQNSTQNNIQNQNTISQEGSTLDSNNIDINTVMKITSAFNSINNSKANDPRANLLNSLKPYLRDSKKDKLDSYINLLNVTKIAEIMKNEDLNNNRGE